MNLRTTHFTTVAAGLLALSTVMAQSDSSSYGGPDGEDLYLELNTPGGGDAEIGAVHLEEVLEWDVNDSLLFIPGYDVYCHWNTESIFDRGKSLRSASDTLRLYLGHDDCDHAIPCIGHVTSPFGPRKGRMHYGVDLKLQTGDPVMVAFDGMVRISKYNKSFGHVVVIRHFNGLETLYAHLSERSVKPGDLVHAGDTLGLGGNTGRSFGSHLHFEVRFMDDPIDPAEVFDLSNGTLRSRTFDIHEGTFARIAAAKAELAARKYHVVRNGDTLSGIARRYGTSVSRLTRLNGVSSTSILRIGQRVRYN